MSDDSGGPKRTWWFQIDLTLLLVLAGLGAVGWFAKAQYDKYQREEIIAVQRIKDERDAKEKEQLEEQIRLDKIRVEEAQIRHKEEFELGKIKAAEALRAKEEHQQREIDRRASAEASEKHRAELMELEMKRRRDDAAKNRVPEKDTSKDKEAFIQSARDQYASALRDIEEQQKKSESFQSRTIAYQNKLKGAQKTVAALQTQLTAAQKDNGRGVQIIDSNRQNSGGAFVTNRTEEINKLNQKIESANKEATDAQAGLAAIQAEKDAIELAVTNAKSLRDGAVQKLKSMGADVTVSPTATPKPAAANPTSAPAAAPGGSTAAAEKESTPAAPGSIVYVLKDGKRVVALKSVDAGDSWSVKTESGKFIVIAKDDIEKIEK